MIGDGADLHARGGPYNQTALLTATTSEWAGADTLHTLLAHGADPNTPDAEGEKPLDWAIYRNDKAKIAALEKYGAMRGDGPRRQPIPAPGAALNTDPRVSVERSVSLLLKAAPPIFQQRRCFSCHHNTVPAETAALARRKGIAIPEELARKNVGDVLRQAAMPAMQAQSSVPGGVGMTVGYGLMALSAENYPPNHVTALTHCVATSAPVWNLLRRCLERDPQRRLRDLGEARIVLDHARDGSSSPQMADGRVPRSRASPIDRSSPAIPCNGGEVSTFIAPVVWAASSRMVAGRKGVVLQPSPGSV